MRGMSQARENMPICPCCQRQKAHLRCWGEVVVLGHSQELDRRTIQEKYWEREKGTSHPGYRAATGEQLVKEEKDTDPGNNLMISQVTPDCTPQQWPTLIVMVGQNI